MNGIERQKISGQENKTENKKENKTPIPTELTITDSKSTIEAQAKGVKYVQR